MRIWEGEDFGKKTKGFRLIERERSESRQTDRLLCDESHLVSHTSLGSFGEHAWGEVGGAYQHVSTELCS